MRIFNSKTPVAHSSRASLSLRQFFIPTLSQSSLYLLISCLTLILINARAIWELFSNNYLTNASFNEFVNQSAPGVTQQINQLQASRLPLYILWGLIGCSIYIIVWFISTTAGNIRNDLIADSYLHPIDYDRRGFWGSVIGRKAFLLFLSITLIAYVYAFVQFLGAISKLFYSAIEDFRLSPSVVEIVLSIAAVAILIHVLIVITHLVYNSGRQIYFNF